MENLKKEIIFENDRSLLEVETDGNFVSLTTTVKGSSDTSIYMYKEDLEKALKFINSVNSEKVV